MVESIDVYISFDRLEDTVRYSFISHLSAAFHRRGLSSFFDGENGSDPETSGISTLAAVEDSRACVVVFSEKYSSSSSCLEDLAIVSERRRNNGIPVVPVFYAVTKSFVTKQIWKLGDVRSELRTGLLETVDLPNHESSNNQSDSEFVEEIVADVREKLDKTEKIGIYSKLLRIENLICKQPWGVRSIGLWGMPGIGKTTLAEAFFDQMSGDYAASCFIKDFNKEFHDKGLYCLLEKHFGKIGAKSTITRPILLRKLLRHKRVLVVLDDVRKPLDAESFLGGFDWFSPGSLIIITSRDKQVFSLCRVNQIYQVPGLNEEDAMQLFSRCALGKEIKHESLQKLSMKVIEYANGNPLALKVFGKKSRKNPREMEMTFLKLDQSPPHEIHDAVKSTYYSLSSNEKNMFLDIACLFRGENVDCMMHLLEGCGFYARVEVNVLVDKCLVSISEGRVVMHNLIQDIGRKIINGGKKPSRLWEPSSIEPFQQDKRVSGSESIKAIFLDPSCLSFDIKPMTFGNMYNLKYLKICSWKPGKKPAIHLPKGLQSLPDELRLLHWDNFPLLSLPQDYDTRNLVILNMCYSQLQKLWQGSKELKMLKRIMLCHSQQLVDIQELQTARNIEVIDLQGCAILERFIPTGHFQHLRVINLSGCTKIKTFPEVPPNIEELYLKETGIKSIPTVTFSPQDYSFIYDHGDHKFLNREDSSDDSQTQSVMVYLEYLKVLDMTHCSELEGIQSIPKNLRKLYLGGTAIQELPSLVHLSKLVVLDLENCKELQRLPMGMINLNSLEVLNLSGCSELEDIEGIPRNLKELYLDGTAIHEVTSSIKHLSELVILDLQNCKSLRHLPLEISNLKSLVRLKLSDSSGRMSTLETAMSDLNHLLLTFNKNANQHREYMPLPRLPSSRLYGLIPRFYALVSLSLCNASLMHIPEEICSLPSLKVLDLSRNGFRTIPESIKQLSKLHSLRLRHCRNVKSLPELPQSLKFLNLHGCVSLQSVSWASEQFPSHYTFNNCFNKSPEVARERVVKSLAKVASIGKEHQQELVKALAFSICAPSGVGQTPSYNLQTGSFATIELTSSLRKTLLGFAIFVVVTFLDDSHSNAGLGVRCISTWKTKKKVTSRVEKVFRCWAPREAPEVQRDHMFVFYEDAKMHQCGDEDNETNLLADHVKFEFQAVSGRNKVLGGNCMVTECDVCVIKSASGVASLSVISASKVNKNHSPKLSSVLGKLRFRPTGRFVGCVCP
uniref:Disease resistance protein RRS1 n=1 Tax=Noccaea caerulescens TaxID=107243 RepID=A0A1J3FF21_NOCCA